MPEKSAIVLFGTSHQGELVVALAADQRHVVVAPKLVIARAAVDDDPVGRVVGVEAGCPEGVVAEDDSETGTVRLKRAVDKVDEMALDTASTKTTRIRG